MSLFIYIFIFLLSIAFFTLFERKILGYSQMRVSPNKVFIFGIIQPILDGIKLLIKEFTFSYKSNKLFFFISSTIMFIIMFMLNICSQMYFNFMLTKLFFFILLSLFGLNVYSIMLLGWSSFSKYSMIGGIRACSQSISYEILLSILIIIFFYLVCDMNKDSFFYTNMYSHIILLFYLFLCLIIETNRTPFDFSEGESELISGFNIELSSNLFVLMFLGEYGMMIFCCSLLSYMFLFMNSFFIMFLMFLFMILRSSLPRFRYDMLMSFLWKDLLSNFCLLFICMIIIF